jgi:hypothetical protein
LVVFFKLFGEYLNRSGEILRLLGEYWLGSWENDGVILFRIEE